MIEFGKREAAAAAALVGVAVVGGIGWSVLQQRQQATVEDLKPTFADGTPAKTAGPDGTVEIPAAGPEETPNSPEPAPEATEAAPPAADKSGQIVVFVSGAVKRPGVYTFKPGARIYHAVRAAGGFKANAQQDALNQAETLRDADQIYIPPRSKAAGGAGGTVSVASSGGRLRPEMFQSNGGRRVSVPPPAVTVRPLIIEGTSISSAKTGETAQTPSPRERGRVLGKPVAETVTVATVSSDPPPAEETAPGETETAAAAEPAKTSGRSRGGSGGATAKFKNPGDGLVNINTAGAAELQKLPGVGPSTAQKFIEYRTQIGRFASVEQVQDIKGIGPKKFAKLRPFMTL